MVSLAFLFIFILGGVYMKIWAISADHPQTGRVGEF